MCLQIKFSLNMFKSYIVNLLLKKHKKLGDRKVVPSVGDSNDYVFPKHNENRQLDTRDLFYSILDATCFSVEQHLQIIVS